MVSRGYLRRLNQRYAVAVPGATSGYPAAVDGAQAGEEQGEAEGNEDDKLKPERQEPGAAASLVHNVRAIGWRQHIRERSEPGVFYQNGER